MFALSMEALPASAKKYKLISTEIFMETINLQINQSQSTTGYPIYIGASLLKQPELLRKHVAGNQVLIVSNDTIAPLYLDAIKNTFHDLQCDVVILPDGEQYKTLATLETIFNTLLENGHNRTTTLIALGGGVVGDITGYAAASYQRGVSFLQVPTTMLAQVDSSVGGKTAVNHPLGKNMIGAFHQPGCVLIDTDTLKTLPEREFSAGLAEVIKYGLIQDLAFFEWLENNIEKLLAQDLECITYAIKRSCQNKADIVAEDEKEKGVRALLNLGHTFGHAIETSLGYGKVLHGEAVSIGMNMAADLSMKMQWITQEEALRVGNLLQKADLPIVPPVEMTPEKFLAAMAVDKKTLNKQIRLVLLKQLGTSVISTDFSEDLLERTLAMGLSE